MSPLTWTGKQLGLFWLGAVALAALLVGLGSLSWPRGPWKFFWLLPYPSRWEVAWHLVRAAFTQRPLEATGLIAVPLLATATTVVWIMARLWRR